MGKYKKRENKCSYDNTEHPFDEYDFIGFKKSDMNYFKYEGVIREKRTDKIICIPFGNSKASHYKDTTGLGLYSDQDTLCEDRKWMHNLAYGQEFSGYCRSYFCNKYLWS